MSADIQQAAISYFGLPEGTSLVEGGPVGAFAFVIPLTEEHLRGIADRMKALAEPIEQLVFAPNEMKTRDELRAEYNAMPAAEKAKWGSFGRYEAHSAMGMAGDDAIEPSEGAGGRKVQHVDVPEADARSALPDAVWVPQPELTQEQIMMSSDTKAGGGAQHWLIQTAMLTTEQQAKYAKGGA